MSVTHQGYQHLIPQADVAPTGIPAPHTTGRCGANRDTSTSYHRPMWRQQSGVGHHDTGDSIYPGGFQVPIHGALVWRRPLLSLEVCRAGVRSMAHWCGGDHSFLWRCVGPVSDPWRTGVAATTPFFGGV